MVGGVRGDNVRGVGWVEGQVTIVDSDISRNPSFLENRE